MSLKRKILNFFTALVMVFGNVPFTFADAYAAEPAGDAPTSLKTVKSNEDGTYDITLEIEGKSSGSVTGGEGANVVILFDTSGSMKDETETREVYTESDTGAFGLRNGTYVRLYYYSRLNRYEVPLGGRSGTVYYYNSSKYDCDGPDHYYCKYTGTRYSRSSETVITSRRISAATDSINSLASALLSKPNVEISLIEFNSKVQNNWDFTDDYDTFSEQVAKMNVDGPTNWEAALKAAKSYIEGLDSSRSSLPAYVILVSDGKPTCWSTKISGKADETGSCYKNSGGKAWGNGNENDSSNFSTSKSQAVKAADALKGLSNVTLYTVGVFGGVDEDTMSAISDDFFSADNEETLNNAFALITEKIDTSTTISDLKISDGITAATSTEVKGNPASFRYKVPESWGEDYEKAEFKDGSVIWNPGKDKTLSNGEKASVTFTVWPSQEAMNCIAEIKNGGNCSEADLEAFGLEKSGDSYKLKTNTTASFTYRTRTTTNGEVSDSLESTPQVMTEERDDTTLPETLLSVTKVWADGMQKSQRTDEYGNGVVLTLSVDGKDVEKFEFSGNEDGNEWENGYTYAVAPGVMKKLNGEDDPIQNIAEKLVTVNGKIYAVLESGHDYVFSETPDSGHYELTKKSFHPMIVDDGKIHDVVFDGKTATIESVEMTKLFAENTLNGGILVSKVVYNNGEKDLSIEDKFEIKISLSEKSGTYRILTMNEDGSQDRGDKKDYTDGEIVEKISQNQQILVTDVPTGTTFEVSETIPEGYTNKIEYGLIDYNTGETKKDIKEVFGNSSSTVTVMNYLESGNLKISKKVVNENGDADAISGKKFTFVVLLNGANYETVELEDGDEVILKNLPAGAKYEVSETNLPLGFEVSELKLEGEIVKGETGEANFTNTYSVKPENKLKNIELRAMKDFNDFWNKLGEGDGFTFVLTDEQTGKTYDSKVLDSINNNVATFSFNQLGIEIDSFGTGEYKYIISEKTPTAKGVSRVEGDADIYVTVKVKDSGYGYLLLDSIKYAKGQTAGGDGEAKTIYNTYESIYVGQDEDGNLTSELEFEKKVKNHDIWGMEAAEVESYTFELRDEDGKVVGTATTDYQTHKFSFGAFEFTKEDIGTHKYTIVETEKADYTEDATKSLSLSITISRDNDGKLTKVVEAPEGRVYTNDYKASTEFGEDPTQTCVSGEVCEWVFSPLSFEKVLKPRGWTDEDSFTFEISGGDEKHQPTVSSVVATKENHEFSFGKIEFTQDDIGKTFEYKVKEVSGTGNGVVDKTKEITVRFTVYDGTDPAVAIGAGKLGFILDLSAGYSKTYTNEYSASSTTEDEFIDAVKSKLVKVLEDKSKSFTSETFQFSISDGSKNLTATVDAKASQEDKDGKIVLSGDDFTLKEGAIFSEAGDYNFTVSEVAGNTNGMNYDSAQHTLKIKVSDNEKGKLVISNVEVDGSDQGELKFTNIYTAEATDEDDFKATFDGKIEKTLIDKSNSLSNETFEFEIREVESGKTAIASATVSKEKTAETGTAKAMILSSEIVFEKAGTYTLEISEKAGTLKGMTYDSSKKTVRVEVSDVDGKLVIGDVETVSFKNEYKAGAVVIGGDENASSEKLSVTKIVSGENLPEAAHEKVFTFELKDKEAGDVKVSETVKAKDGETKNFTTVLTFEKEGVYTYTISEVNEHQTGDGWVYDNNNERTVTITVTTNVNDGKLVANISEANQKFTNTYSASATEPGEFIEKIQITKKIEDKSNSAKDGTFEFQIVGTDGDHAGETYNVSVSTQGLTGIGKPLTGASFTKAGKYNFTVFETKRGEVEDGMTFDNHEETITVVVVDDGTGKLSISEVINNNPTFTNVYEASPVVIGGEDATTSEMFKITKAIDGETDGAKDQEFEFNVELDTGKSVEDGTGFRCGTIKILGRGTEMLKDVIELKKAGKYTFKVYEIEEKTPGYAYDSHVETVVLEVVDEDGELKLKDSITPVSFTNVYTQSPVTDENLAELVEALTIRKFVLDNSEEGTATEETFEFEVMNLDTMSVETVEITTNSEGTAKPSADTLRTLLAKVGEYNFEISEVAGSAVGYTYDSTVYHVMLEVKDVDSQLVATAKISIEDFEADGIKFFNEYNEPGKGEVEDETPAAPDTGRFTSEIYGDSASGDITFTAAFIATMVALGFWTAKRKYAKITANEQKIRRK